MPAQGGRDPGTVGRRGTRRGVRFLEGSTVDSREIGFTDLCVCVCVQRIIVSITSLVTEISDCKTLAL